MKTLKNRVTNEPTVNKDYSAEFVRVSSLLSDLMIELNIPDRDAKSSCLLSLAAFSALDEIKRIRINQRLKFYAELCSNSISSGFKGLNDARVSWYAIKKLGLVPPAGLFEQISDTDCVEIYDGDGIQVFRNFNFCEHVTYSIQECLIYPWDQLYERSEDILEIMMSEAKKAFVGTNEPFLSNIPVHTCTEIKTASQRKYQVEFNVISPLFDPTGNSAAFLVTSRLRVLRDIGADNTLELR